MTVGVIDLSLVERDCPRPPFAPPRPCTLGSGEIAAACTVAALVAGTDDILVDGACTPLLRPLKVGATLCPPGTTRPFTHRPACHRRHVAADT